MTGRAPSGQALVASQSSPQAVSTEGFDPSRKRCRRKPRDNFVKRRKHATSLKKGTGGINPCWRPSNEASKADLAEYHAEEMKLRRQRQLNRAPGFIQVPAK